MKKVTLFILVSIFAINCNKDTSSINPEVEDQEQTDNQDDGDENQDSNEGSENLDIDINLELTGLPSEIFEVEIFDLPGTVEDYSLEIGETEIPIHNLTASKFEFVTPFNLIPSNYEISLKYLDQIHPIGTLQLLDLIDVVPSGYVIAETDNTEYPLIVSDSINRVILPRIIDNDLVGVILNTDDGDEIYLELNEYYLPTYARVNSTNIIIDNYQADVSLANIAYFDDINPTNIVYEKDVIIDSEIMASAVELHNSETSKGDLADALDILEKVGVGISAFRCILGLTTASAGGAVLLYSCKDFAKSLAEYALEYTLEKIALQEAADNLDTALKIRALNGIKKCRDLVKLEISPEKLLGSIDECYNGFIATASLIADSFEDKKEENQEINDEARINTCEIACGGVFDPNDESTWMVTRNKVLARASVMTIIGINSWPFNLYEDGSAIGGNGLTGSWSFNGRSFSLNLSNTYDIETTDENGEPTTLTCTDSQTFTGILNGSKEFLGSGLITCSCCGSNESISGQARVSL
ncbi:hypothetical protein [uncultured Zobellia sp.]|uniref:hypothetical protein n=1 Tax=uncultured Zobellia sp. TaxID=255433 RepID=UPI002592387D|nr:hypothetical protein [uncultured Zobellia sp.]